MKYRVDLTIKGFIEISAESKEEARSVVEDGYSLSNVHVEDDDIDDITLVGD